MTTMATTATQAGLPGGPISSVAAGVMHVDEVEASRRALGMSPRQQVLDKYWSFYRCDQYAARTVSWDGSRHLGMVERDTVALAGYVPPGFYVANPDTLPVALRRPTTPYHIVKVIVDRFTGMLFSQKRHPKITVEGDPKTEDFLNAVAEAGRLWPTMMRARAHGGGMGTACVGFKLIAGRPVFEVFDPRWCHPRFLDRSQLVLEALDYRYVFTQEVRDEVSGEWREVPYWYRRVVDRTQDVVFKPLPVEDNVGGRPWEVAEVVKHNLGFCPVVWIQNMPNETDLDGDSDCMGVLDMAEAIDRLNSQSEKGTIANCFGHETSFVTDRGVRRFSDFLDGDRVRVMTPSGKWASATVKNFGKQSLWAVSMRRGPQGGVSTIRATRNHRWLLADGSETSHVEAGDQLKSAPRTFNFEYDTATPEEKSWWCRGFIWGDGSTYSSNVRELGCRARLCGPKARFAPRFQECGFKTWVPENLCGDVMVRSSEIRKELPDLDSTPVELLAAFVRGYVEADASRSSKGSSRWGRIQVTGEASVAFVRRAFPAVGLYISQEVDMTGTSTNYGTRSARTVRFQLNENLSDHHNSLWKVVAVDDLSVIEDVWCLVVDDHHSFVLPIGVSTRNCDPTVVLTTNAEMGAVTKGSGAAIKLPMGSDAKYMEMTGSGIQSAKQKVEDYKAMMCEVTACVLSLPDRQMTATEVERLMAPMLAKADMLREQYGEQGVKRLLNMICVAAKRITTPRAENGGIVKQSFTLPDKIVMDDTGNVAKRVPRSLGEGPYQVTLSWPTYYEPDSEDALKAVGTAVQAKVAGLVDLETAVRYIAQHFGVENIRQLIQKLQAAQSDDQAALELAALMGPRAASRAQAQVSAGEEPSVGGR